MFMHPLQQLAPRAAVLALTVALAGCSGSIVGPGSGDSAGPESSRVGGHAADGTIAVLNRNLFVGTDIESILATPDVTQIPVAVAEAFGRVQATNFPERAAALAAEIDALRPDLVGLQEVSLFRIQTPGDFLAGNTQEAQTIVLDYLAVLLDALRGRGLSYRAVASSPNIDLEVPMYDPASPSSLSDVRLTDFDVVLARSDVTTENAKHANYAVNLEVPLAGATIVIRRGYSAVDATVAGRTYRFVNTHLEPTDPIPGQFIPDFQIAQMTELLGQLDDPSVPTILVGDFSTDAQGGPSPASRLAEEAGFVDLWTVGRRRGPGYTCCQDPDLLNPASKLDRRVDIVYFRDGSTATGGPFRGSVQAQLVGDEQADRTPSGLWPSDHAGVAARIRYAPGLELVQR